MSDLPATTGKVNLPATYTAAKSALAKCVKLDECREWANKADAMIAYGKQAKDTSMVDMATRIATRAMDRLGELIDEIPKAQGTRSDLVQPTTPSEVTRKDAIKSAGLSVGQGLEAVRLARFKAAEPEEYEAMLENPEGPATRTEMAERGKQKRTPKAPPVKPPEHSHPQFRVALNVNGSIKDTAEQATKHDPKGLAEATRPDSIAGIIQGIDRLRSWLDDYRKELRTKEHDNGLQIEGLAPGDKEQAQ